MSQEPVVAVVVVTWNSAQILPGLLASLDDGMKALRWHVIIADNASADESVAVARRLQPHCQVVQTGRNAGYAAAFNAALALAAPFDAVLLLNPDVRLGPGSGRALFERLGSGDGPRVGIAVPRLLDEHGNVAPSLRREPSIARAFGEAVLGQWAGRWASFGETIREPAAYRGATVVDWATGAAMLMSAACLDVCGPWDESFFLYSEETEFALRARDNGYLTMLVPDAEAVHLGGESGASPRLWSLLVVNRVRLYRKRHRALPTALFWAAVFLRESIRAALGNPCSRRAVRALLRPSTVETG